MNRLHEALRPPATPARPRFPSNARLPRRGYPPPVSLLIPAYNSGAYIAAAIRSALAQDYPELEIVISDDASTDGSAALIRSLVREDPRVRFVAQPRNLGMVANWNWCLAQARGTYVKFLFGDDVLTSPDSVARLVHLLDAHPLAVLATSARELIDGNSHPAGVWNHLRTPGWHPGPAVVARCFLSGCNLIGEPSAVLLRRAALERGFDPALRQLVDLELWLRLLQRGDLVYTPESLVAFRRHARQQTQINARSAVGQIETLGLIERFLGTAERRRAAGIGEFDYRFIQFRTLHALRKAARRHPRCQAAADALARQLPPGWRFTCHLRHRLARPFENLARSLRKRERPLRPALAAT